MKSRKKNKFIKRLLMDITTRCNIACIMCPVPHETDKYDMPPDLFDKISKEIFPYTESVILSCDYEPLVSSTLTHMLKSLSIKDDFSKTLFTNGMLLSKNISQMILDASVDKLIVSIHGSEKTLYESISLGASFHKLLENINGFLKVKEQGSYKRTKLEFVMTVLKRNIFDIPGIVKLAGEFGVKKVSLRRVCGYPEESIENSGPEIRKYFSQALKLADKSKIQLDYPPEFEIVLSPEKYEEEKYENNIFPEFCEAKEGVIWINPDGVIRPCNNWSGEAIGDLKKNSFREIWESDKYNRIRSSLTEEIHPDNCYTCHIYETLLAAGKIKKT